MSDKKEEGIVTVNCDDRNVIVDAHGTAIAGITPKQGRAVVRMNIEGALRLVDDLKRNIAYALKNR